MSIAYYSKHMITERIGLKIKFERQKRDFSQENLALAAGLSRSALWKIETGKASPTIESLEKIARALNMEFSELTDVSKVDL